MDSLHKLFLTPYSVSPRKDYILFSTRTPPAIQRIPWPAIDDEDLDIDSARARRRRSWTGYDTWMMNEHELPWLLDASGRSSPVPTI
jgi:hypothetical protein